MSEFHTGLDSSLENYSVYDEEAQELFKQSSEINEQVALLRKEYQTKIVDAVEKYNDLIDASSDQKEQGKLQMELDEVTSDLKLECNAMVEPLEKVRDGLFRKASELKQRGEETNELLKKYEGPKN